MLCRVVCVIPWGSSHRDCDRGCTASGYAFARLSGGGCRNEDDAANGGFSSGSKPHVCYEGCANLLGNKTRTGVWDEVGSQTFYAKTPGGSGCAGSLLFCLNSRQLSRFIAVSLSSSPFNLELILARALLIRFCPLAGRFKKVAHDENLCYVQTSK